MLDLVRSFSSRVPTWRQIFAPKLSGLWISSPRYLSAFAASHGGSILLRERSSKDRQIVKTFVITPFELATALYRYLYSAPLKLFLGVASIAFLNIFFMVEGVNRGHHNFMDFTWLSAITGFSRFDISITVYGMAVPFVGNMIGMAIISKNGR